ncbi:MAG: YbbR-like domain-containing protein [Mariniphaga sp.]
MNHRISKIASSLRLDKIKTDRRIFVFSVCLLIATTLWFLDVLSNSYNAVLHYNLKYVNPPENLFLANNPPSSIDLRVEAHGFTLLRHKLAFSFSPILLDLSAFAQNMESVDSNVRITSENLIRRIGNQVSNEISIIEVSPSTILLRFDSLESRVVPVKPFVTLNFKPQYNLNGTVVIKPDSVEISGPAGVLDTISALPTVPVTFNDLETSVEQFVRVQHPVRTELSPDRVLLSVPVEKFTEKKITLPVQINNLPKDVQIKLFPAQVTVSVMVGLSSYESISSADFTATVDYNQVTTETETLDVQIEASPLFIQLVKVTPSSVEYIIENEKSKDKE